MQIACATNSGAQVITYEIDPTFNTGDFYSRGAINEIIMLEEQGYLISGFFGHGATAAKGITIVGFAGQELFNGHSQGMGSPKLLSYRGKFLGFGAQVLQWWEPGGTDYSFRFEFQKQVYSGPLSNVALDAMVLPNDHILVAGRFFTDSTLMGTSIASQGLRQLCMIDSTGAPVPDFPMLRCEWPTNSEIYRIAKLNSGGYIISGRFQEVEGHATNHVARLHDDFSVDTTFISPFAFRNGAVVFIQLIDVDDRILVTGSNAELANDPDTYPGLVRLLPNGLLDATFSIPDIIFINPPTGIVNPIRPGMVVEDLDGTYIIVGQFQWVNGSPRKGLAKLSENGELIDGSFEGFGVDEAVWGSWQEEPGINRIVDVGEGKWLLGGRFSSFGGEPYSCLVRLQPSGFVGTDDHAKRGALKVYPNPVRHYFQIELPEGMDPMQQVDLCDLQGRLLRSWPAAQSSYPTDGLPAGMYVVRASSRDGAYTQKLIFEH